MSQKVYEIINNKILEMLDNGIVPWHKTWKNMCSPVNMVTKKPYRGINWFLLSCATAANGYKSNKWATYEQINKKKGFVKKGEKSTMIVFWTFINKEDTKKNGEVVTKKIPLLRYYNVFNLDQTSIEDKVELNENEHIASAEMIIDGYEDCPKINHGGDTACYVPSLDVINMPLMGAFENSDKYYQTLFHEIVHSTGSENRLKRISSCNKNTDGYAREELVAEFGATFLADKSGITPTYENSASYIATWKSRIKADEKCLIVAASAAQKAVDYVLGVKKDESEPIEQEVA